MSTTSTPTYVVVAVDGSGGSDAAVTYGAQEARTRGLPLELVTVIPAYLPAGPFPVAPEATLREGGREILEQARELAVATGPDLEILTTLLIGARVDAMVQHAHDAALLVVAAPPHGLVERLWTGSTVTGLAARASCPLVIVRPGATPTPRVGRVVVGLRSTRHAEPLLGAAFAVARQTQSDLTVVHAWHQLSGYDDAIAQRSTGSSWVTEQVRMIEDDLIDLRMAYPDVQVQVRLVHGQPAWALVEESRSADLLLVTRPTHGGLVHHLGATVRALIRDAACPVEVVPPVREAPRAELVDAGVATLTHG